MSMTLSRQLSVATVVTLLAACSSSPAPGDGLDVSVIDATDTASGDTPDLEQDAVADTEADTGDAGEDIDPDEGSGGGLGVGEICMSDRECASFLCFRFDASIEEGFCTQYCRDNANCPADGFECVFLANSGGDFAKVCAPDNLCIDRDGDGFGIGPSCAGPDCDDATDTIFLGADEVCDGVDNDCDGNIDENTVGANSACFTGFPGVCSTGRLLCVDGLSDCVAERRASDEICDGLDNDCDGATDEGADGQPLTDICYGGPAATLGVGACRAGVRTCVDGSIGDCVGAVLPFTEICDGIDNDCDGETDEGLPGAGQPCDVPGALGACVRGRTQCTEAGELICVAERAASEENCDGIDNDCDGQVDENADGEVLQRACYGGPEETRGVGSCVDGTQVCDGGDWTVCDGALLPVAEVCNGLDDDCDGDTDEDGAAGGFVCSTGLLGACARGVTVCTDLGTECVQAVAASEEICDGVDNDCDGEVDTHGDGRALTRTCYGGPAGTAGQGICTAGVQTCGADGFGLCVGEQRPQFEVCDGVDNDCDGQIDEGNPGGGIACSTGNPGICAAGTTVCRSGELLCEAPATPGSQAEICDGLDNDCDGSVDEGFPGLGTPCFSGLGNCRRAGVTVCNASNRSAPPICDAVAGTPSPFEVCDYSDDDCDGSVDEGFVDGSGRYTQVANCGGCGIDCNNLWPGGAALYNVAPLCATAGGSLRCDFACLPGWEDADGVQENGCEFFPESDTIYVSAPGSGASDAGSCGAWTAPCATITRGLARAVAAGALRVRVSTGVYRENITLRNGVSLLGGHNPRNWSRDAGINVTVITGNTPSPTSADRIAVNATGITSSTELSGFTINGENAGDGGNSIAVYVLNSNNNLRITNNRVFAGTGGIGVSGTAGTNGANGTNGSPGLDRLVGTCPGTARSGGSAGSRECGASVSGGAGGSSNAPVYGQVNPTAPNGSGLAPGAGGAGGSHMQGQYTRNGFGQITGRTCNVNLIGPTDGAAGARGADGSDAVGGGGGTGAGSLTGSPRLWRAASGASGASGTSGSGGGGGGASGGITATDPPFCTIGASGGGGGSGGCAGGAGTGGTGGGGSFAIFVAFDTAPASAAVMPAITGNTLARAAGGNGGSGGNGGAGGLPGEGGRGGLVPGGDQFDFCLTPGGAGGNGGRGGHGGGGGGGAGGASFDVFIAGAGGRDPGYNANTFAVPAATNTGGRGGSGGASLNPGVGVGVAGTNGAFGNVGGLN